MANRPGEPIETCYRGYRFRSRLEARWAVFFDALDIAYQYELEGFELKRGRFLPDFFLPDQDVWVEVKPTSFAFPQSIRPDAKVKRLVDLACLASDLHEATKKKVLRLSGEPYKGQYSVLVVPDPFHLSYIFALGRRDEREVWLYSEDAGALCLNPRTDDERWPLSDHPKLLQAYEKARGARFEFGEHGTPGRSHE